MQWLFATTINILLFLPTTITWLTPTEHDFGDLVQNEGQSVNFVWQNTTADTLLIDNVRVTCGCTAPTWTYDPIPPGAIDTIMVGYDAKRPGYFRKVVRVFFSNQRTAHRLVVAGFVEEQE